MFIRFTIFLLLFIIGISSHAQDSTGKLALIGIPDSTFLPVDSILHKGWRNYLKSLDTLKSPEFKRTLDFGLFKLPSVDKPLWHVDGAVLSYQYTYRSGMDTPIVEKHLSQHLVSGSLDMTIAKAVPIRIYYLERQSNSTYFKDFRDVRVELNTYGYQRIRQQKFRDYLNSIGKKIMDPYVQYAREASKKSIEDSRAWLNYSANRKKLIDSKELIMAHDMVDTSFGVSRDSVLKDARKFIALYDQVEANHKAFLEAYDSLDRVYITAKKRIQQLNKLANGNLGDYTKREEIEDFVKINGLYDKQFSRLSDRISAIRTFAVGRTMPNQSNLTLKNTNVKGVDFVYNKNNLIAAVAAGSIDFRVREFVYNGQRRLPQYVYSVKAGIGRLEGNNLVVTYYEGKKQLYNGQGISKSQPVKGVSLATQVLLGSNLRIGAEVAQSAAPTSYSASAVKPNLDFGDKNSLAYSFIAKGYFPRTGTRFDGLFQHTGINFQSFTNYRVNAAADSWSLRAEQNFWNRQIRLIGALKKNDYSNPTVLQRYDANTVFKNLTVSFQRRHWPVISFGYMPSSQLTIVDSLVYENHYQILNATSTYQYKIGVADATTSLAFNKFFNHSQDTGFLYFNSANLFFSQSFKFSIFSTVFTATHTDNGNYMLDVWDEGIYFNLFKPAQLGFGVKVFHLDIETASRVGFYWNGRIDFKRMGQLNFWLEKSYLPNIQHRLSKNELYNIGYTKYFSFN